jgi:Bacterial conjugation TrbI-like protein
MQTSNSRNSHEADNLSEAELAALAGVSSPQRLVPSVDLSGLVEADDDTSSIPKQRELWNNPFVKAGSVGLVTLCIVGAAGLVLVGVNLNLKTPPRPLAVAPVKPPEEPEDPTGGYKTELALGKQERELKGINRPTGAPLVRRTLPPGASAPVAQVRSLPPELPQRISPPQIRQLSAGVSKTQIYDLAKIGSYGQVNGSGQVQAVQLTQSPRIAQSQQVAATASADEIPVLQGGISKQLLISTTADGVIVNPLIAEGNTIQGGGQQATIRLSSPLLYDDGSVAVPAGTEVIAKLQSISSNGFVQMIAVSLLMIRNGRRYEVPLPQSAISIWGVQGQPLIAKSITDRGQEIASQDAGQFLAGGAQRGAELFNRATAQTATSSLGITTAATSYPPINLLAGIIEGGSSQLTTNLAARSRAAINSAVSRPNIWSVQANTPVQLIVNQTVGFEP